MGVSKGVFMSFSARDLSFHQRLGHLVGQLGRDEFWPVFAAFLREDIAFTSWVLLIFRANEPPLLIHEGDANDLEDQLFRDYLLHHYKDDPFCRLAIEPFASGPYRLDEVIEPDFRSSEYYRSYFAKNVVEDEIQLLAPFLQGTAQHGVLSLSLGSERRFTSEEYGLLSLVSPWLLPLLAHAASLALGELRIPTERPNRSELEQRLRSLDGIRLTEREVQTALLLLSGQSTRGIAAHLGIAPETAKVHRRNLYDKLGVNSQIEVFALFASLPDTTGARKLSSL